MSPAGRTTGAVEPGGSAPAPPMVPAPGKAAVLVAHGSADPAAAAMTRALVRAVAAARPGLDVRPAYLDHDGPRPGEVLAAIEALGHHREAVVAPLLLTAAYHDRVDLPQVLATAYADGLRLPVRIADVLGPTSPHATSPHATNPRESAGAAGSGDLAGGDRRAGAVGPAGGQHPAGAVVPAPLLAALRRRLTETGVADFDAVVLAAAGTRDATARGTVDQTAAALSQSLAVPCRAAYASAAAPTPGEAVARLRAEGAHRVAVAAYFLATGQLYHSAAADARAAGAVTVAAPLADAWELAHLILARIDTARPGWPAGGAELGRQRDRGTVLTTLPL